MVAGQLVRDPPQSLLLQGDWSVPPLPCPASGLPEDGTWVLLLDGDGMVSCFFPWSSRLSEETLLPAAGPLGTSSPRMCSPKSIFRLFLDEFEVMSWLGHSLVVEFPHVPSTDDL